MGSFFKYYRETKDADGTPLHWPGGPEGFPFRGSPPQSTTQTEFDNLKLTGNARCKLFYLAKKEDLAEYISIRDKCANGLFVLLDRERTWDQETNNMRIYMEWLELGYETPPPQYGGNNDSNDSFNSLTKLAGFSKGSW